MKKCIALLISVIIAFSTFVNVFAQAPINVRWDSKSENLNACAGVRFTMIDGISTYKFSLYKDGQLVDTLLYEIESSDNEALVGFEEEIEALGEGSYTVTVGSVKGNLEDYEEVENREEIAVLASATTPTAFVYKEPFHVLPDPTGIKVEGNMLTVLYSGPECMIKASLYADFGDGNFVHVSSGGGNDKTFSIEHWYKNFYNYMDRMIKRDPVKYSEDRAKMLFKAQAFPENILVYKKSGEYTMTMDAPKRPEDNKAEATPVPEAAPVPETKPELVIPGANEPEIDETGRYNPFNNSLFSIVSEFEIPDEVQFPIFEFETVENFMNYDESAGRMTYTPILFKVDYDGNVLYRQLIDPTYDSNQAKQICNQILASSKRPFSYDGNPGVYNDGIKFGHIGEFSALTNMAEEAILTDYASTGYSYDYNMGLLHEIHAAMGFMNLNYDEYFTIFTKSMTDKTIYEFNALITGFDDNGYAILHTGREADAKHYVIKLKQGIIPTVKYNGNKILFDQIPVIEEGRTLVPLRAIFEALGAKVDWNGDTRTVTAVKDGVTVNLTIDNKVAYKNGEAIELDVPAKIINGRTMVPVRFIADSFGVNVGWDASLSQVILGNN